MMQDAQNESVEAEETAADSLDEAILKAMGESEEVDKVEEDSEEASEVEEAVEAEEAEEAEDVEDEEPEEKEALSPHQHWSSKDKALFTEMPRDVQARWIEREAEYERGIQQKSGELNEVRQTLDEVKAAVAPYVDSWRMKGINPYAGMQRALTIANELDTNPQQALVRLAQERGVNLETAIKDAPYVDPQVLELQREIRELRERQDTAQQSYTQTQQDSTAQQLQAFEQATDADGNLLHPYFRQVMQPMGLLLNNGNAATLDEAYSMAVRYNPEIQNELAAKQEKASIKRKNKAANKAKAASKRVDSSSTGKSTKVQSLDEIIMSQLEASGYE